MTFPALFAEAAALPKGGLTILDNLVIAVFLLSMLGMGIMIARKNRSTEDFFVGGRNLPAWAVGISIFASLLSTITYLGMPGEMFRTGIAFLTRQLPIPLVLVVVLCLWIPFFMRLNLTSAYEYLQQRFNYPLRVMVAVFCLLLLFGWMSVVVLTASMAMAEIANLDLNWFFGTNYEEIDAEGALIVYRDADMHAVIISIGLFSVLYTTLGGIRAVIWTDVIQFLVLMVGAFFTMATVAWMTNSGIGDWIATSQTYKHEAVEWFKPDIGDRSNVMFIALGMFFWFTCTHGANQVALQRYFSVADVKAARCSYLVSALASIGIGIILAGVGISMMHFIQSYDLPAELGLDSLDTQIRSTAQDKIFPQFIRYYLPSGLRGMVVAALFAAAMSTIDSGANSVSTIVTVDFFRPLSGGDVTAQTELRRARMITATMGLFIVAYTIGVYHASKGTDIITLCQKGFNCFLGPMGAVFFLGMFMRSATPASVIPAFVVGEIFGVCSSYSFDLFEIEYSTHLVVPGSWLVTVVVAVVLGAVLQTRATDEQQKLMWAPIVRSGSMPD